MNRTPRTAARLEHILARGVLVVRDWFLARIRRHPLLTDAAIAVAVLAISVPPVSRISGRNHGLSLALAIALVCPLVWRRRAPYLVFLVMIVVALLQFSANREFTDDLALLVANRMIQEALTNTLKHAPGTAAAHVRLTYRRGKVELEVTDEGRPGAMAEPVGKPGSGHGIAGMRERAALFGGHLSAGPRPGGGWLVSAVLPIAQVTTDVIGTDGAMTRAAAEGA
jgi:hypothetical protein